MIRESVIMQKARKSYFSLASTIHVSVGLIAAVWKCLLFYVNTRLLIWQNNARKKKKKKRIPFIAPTNLPFVSFFLPLFSYFYTALSMSSKTYLFFIIIVVLCSFTDTILSSPGFVNIVKKSAKDTDTWFYDCKGDNSQTK